jgi:hypothetical protein
MRVLGAPLDRAMRPPANQPDYGWDGKDYEVHERANNHMAPQELRTKGPFPMARKGRLKRRDQPPKPIDRSIEHPSNPDQDAAEPPQVVKRVDEGCEDEVRHKRCPNRGEEQEHRPMRNRRLERQNDGRAEFESHAGLLFGAPNGQRISGERRAEGDERVRCMRVLGRRSLTILKIHSCRG